MVLYHTVSEIDGDFSRKSQNFPSPVYFAPPLNGFPWELGIGARVQKTRIMGQPGREKSLTISSAVIDTKIHPRDGRTPGDSEDHAYA